MTDDLDPFGPARRNTGVFFGKFGAESIPLICGDPERHCAFILTCQYITSFRVTWTGAFTSTDVLPRAISQPSARCRRTTI